MAWRKKYKTHSKEENQRFALLILLGAVLLIVGFTTTTSFSLSMSNSLPLLLTGIALAVLAITSIIAGQKFIRRKILLNTTLSTIDSMTGIEFEQFLCKLLQEDGYQTKITATSGDFGIDILAYKDDVVLGIQAKRYTASVGVEAVYQVVGGQKYYHCNRYMVVTSSTFTKAARELAKIHFCTLIDRHRLAEWIERVQKKNRATS